MNPEIEKLTRMIEDLKKEVDSLKNPASISLDIRKSLSKRGFIFSDNIDASIDESIYTTSYNLSGDAETIVTFGVPTQWLKIDGTQFVIPIYKQFN